METPNPSLPVSIPSGSGSLCPALCDLPMLTFHTDGTIHCLASWVWLLSVPLCFQGSDLLRCVVVPRSFMQQSNSTLQGWWHFPYPSPRPHLRSLCPCSFELCTDGHCRVHKFSPYLGEGEVCVSALCVYLRAEVRGRLLLGVGFHLPSQGFWWSHSHCQTWKKAPLPPEPSCFVVFVNTGTH